MERRGARFADQRKSEAGGFIQMACTQTILPIGFGTHFGDSAARLPVDSYDGACSWWSKGRRIEPLEGSSIHPIQRGMRFGVPGGNPRMIEGNKKDFTVAIA